MDLAWAAGDAQAKGFLIGATAGRTTLNGEGLQHQDGHSHMLSSLIPNCTSYDPAYGSELAVIFKHGIEEMFVHNKNCFYYITVMNENYVHPPINPAQEQDVIKGMYLFKEDKRAQIRLLGAGAILNEVIKAASILDKFDINSEIWSVTSFNLLRKDGMECDRLSLQDPSDQSIQSFVEDKFSSNNLPVIAASDYVKAYSEQIRPWIKGSYYTLGTDGYGRSDARAKLREFFEVDANAIARSAAYALYHANELSDQQLKDIYKACDHDPAKPHPWEV